MDIRKSRITRSVASSSEPDYFELDQRNKGRHYRRPITMESICDSLSNSGGAKGRQLPHTPTQSSTGETVQDPNSRTCNAPTTTDMVPTISQSSDIYVKCYKL